MVSIASRLGEASAILTVMMHFSFKSCSIIIVCRPYNRCGKMG